MTFGEKLMELRKAGGLSQEELGFRLDVTRQTVSKWETGQTTPEMEKLIALSALFGISIDALVGNGAAAETAPPVIYPRAFHYEYKSKRTLFGLPLLHVNVGVGLRRAKGIVAVGTIAQGVVAVGALSVGVVSLGALCAGLLAFGAAGIGLLLSVGGLAVGAAAAGGIAVGLLAFGGLAFGNYAVGGLACAARIAMGGYARGHIAIGDAAGGGFAWEKLTQLTRADWETIRRTILQEYPRIQAWLLRIFTRQ
ncbi:MAG: helix-turn-helix domain-containing protein [Firmicutes bacterium]|nr:helix-turn-helix domain-containing protein [Bacillota bacterium]